MVETGVEVMIGDEIGGKVVDVSAVEVLIVDEMMVEVWMVYVTKDSLFCTSSPMLTLVSLSDKSIGMFEIRTSSVLGSICKTPGSMTVVFLGMDVVF